eukprot:TRINITY_DN7437_c0_g6_i1.p1 TRINITY_DN7437_c0_g6~~TRINITY_DN7437_c0_g6_i1.p1  ORF type:complete len:295 (+),score=76.55 TRINITY_DN7437_c0_g6_i1:106-990(+)
MIISSTSLLIRRIGFAGASNLRALSAECKVFRGNLLYRRPNFPTTKPTFAYITSRPFSTTNNNNNDNKAKEIETPKDQEKPTIYEINSQNTTYETKQTIPPENSNKTHPTSEPETIQQEKKNTPNDTQDSNQTIQPTNASNTDTDKQNHNFTTNTNANANTDSNTNNTNSSSNSSENNNNSEQTTEAEEGWFKSLPLYKKILYSSIFLSIATEIGLLVHQSNLRRSFPYKLVVPLVQNDVEIQKEVGEDVREPKWYQSTLWGYVGDGLVNIYFIYHFTFQKKIKVKQMRVTLFP